MAEWVYADLTRTTVGGGTLRFTLRGPDLFVPGVWDARLAAALLPVATAFGQAITQEAATDFPWEPMASAFEPIAESAPTFVRAGTATADPIFPFVEWDTAPHWPPWGPGSRLERWAERHDVPVFPVARKIAREGTQGLHAMDRILAQFAESYGAQLQDRIAAVFAGG